MNTPDPTLHCPHCAKPLPEFTLRAAAGLLAKRGRGGRPKSDAPRCPCKANTLARAMARNFDCCKAAGALVAPSPEEVQRIIAAGRERVPLK